MSTRLAYLNGSGAGALETRERALETHEPRCIARLAKHFFIPEAHDAQRAVGHVVVPEPFQSGRQGLEPWSTW
jgi:hypothetical protein